MWVTMLYLGAMLSAAHSVQRNLAYANDYMMIEDAKKTPLEHETNFRRETELIKILYN